MSAVLLLQAGASLAAVLGLVLLAGRVARTRGLAAASDPAALRLTATLALDTHRRLHLVQTQAGQVLVLTGGTADRLLAWPPGERNP